MIDESEIIDSLVRHSEELYPQRVPILKQHLSTDCYWGVRSAGLWCEVHDVLLVPSPLDMAEEDALRIGAKVDGVLASMNAERRRWGLM